MTLTQWLIGLLPYVALTLALGGAVFPAVGWWEERRGRPRRVRRDGRVIRDADGQPDTALGGEQK